MVSCLVRMLGTEFQFLQEQVTSLQTSTFYWKDYQFPIIKFWRIRFSRTQSVQQDVNMIFLCITILMRDTGKKQEVANNLSFQRKVMDARSPMFDCEGVTKASSYINCHPTFLFAQRKSCSGASLQRCIHAQSFRGFLHYARGQTSRILLGNAASVCSGTILGPGLPGDPQLRCLLSPRIPNWLACMDRALSVEHSVTKPEAVLISEEGIES